MIDAAAWAFLVLAIADWGATITLVRAALRIHEAALQERATMSVILTVAATITALTSVAYLGHIRLPDGSGTVLIIVTLGLISVPQLIWYAAYRAGRFR